MNSLSRKFVNRSRVEIFSLLPEKIPFVRCHIIMYVERDQFLESGSKIEMKFIRYCPITEALWYEGKIWGFFPRNYLDRDRIS